MSTIDMIVVLDPTTNLLTIGVAYHRIQQLFSLLFLFSL